MEFRRLGIESIELLRVDRVLEIFWEALGKSRSLIDVGRFWLFASILTQISKIKKRKETSSMPAGGPVLARTTAARNASLALVEKVMFPLEPQHYLQHEIR